MILKKIIFLKSARNSEYNEIKFYIFKNNTIKNIYSLKGALNICALLPENVLITRRPLIFIIYKLNSQILNIF